MTIRTMETNGIFFQITTVLNSKVGSFRTNWADCNFWNNHNKSLNFREYRKGHIIRRLCAPTSVDQQTLVSAIARPLETTVTSWQYAFPAADSGILTARTHRDAATPRATTDFQSRMTFCSMALPPFWGIAPLKINMGRPCCQTSMSF